MSSNILIIDRKESEKILKILRNDGINFSVLNAKELEIDFDEDVEIQFISYEDRRIVERVLDRLKKCKDAEKILNL